MSENGKRLETLFLKHHTWLMQVSYNISKDMEVAEDLVGQLYIYLGEKENDKLYFADSFNLMYCRAFINSRFLNKTKRDKKVTYVEEYDTDDKDEVYDTEYDKKLETTYDSVISKLEGFKNTKMWASAQIAQMYWFNDYTLDEVAEEIGISKSTVFLSVKKIKQLLKETTENPFIKEK
jgi:DNA-directed RNA polymerase specialized sigma24 family protein